MIIRIRRPELRATIVRLAQLEPVLAAELDRQMADGRQTMPPLHQGGSETHRFKVYLPRQQVEGVVHALGDMEASLVAAGAPAFQISATSGLLVLLESLSHLTPKGAPLTVLDSSLRPSVRV